MIISARFESVKIDSETPLPGTSEKPCHLALEPQQGIHFIAMFEQLHRCWLRVPDPLAVAAAGAQVQAILWALREECHPVRPGGTDSLMEDIRLLLDSDPSVQLSVKQLAKRCGLSEGHFTRRFRKHTGVSPKTYQLYSRMHTAKKLLQERGQSVQKVAQEIGYSDPFVFSRQFKKVWGVPPSRI